MLWLCDISCAFSSVANLSSSISLLYSDSIADFSDTVSGTQPKDVMDLLVLTQYFDTIHVRI